LFTIAPSVTAPASSAASPVPILEAESASLGPTPAGKEREGTRHDQEGRTTDRHARLVAALLVLVVGIGAAGFARYGPVPWMSEHGAICHGHSAR